MGPAPLPNPRVVALAYDGLCTFEFGIAVEVFGLPRPEMGAHWYRFAVAAERPGPLRATGGVMVHAPGDLDELAGAGTIVIPGWKGSDVAVPDSLCEALRAAAARGARLVSICSGVFVLAATGLLDGKRATTHWRYASNLAERYPDIEVDPNVLYVDAGQLITSAGSAAGLDACLHLVERDFGRAKANRVARRLVVQTYRDGGQAQFIEPVASARSSNSSFDRLFEWVEQHLHHPLSVDTLAERAAMSPRTFLRRFKSITGKPPGEWLTEARVQRSRELLELEALPIERVAERCGFGSATVLRHHFKRRLGLSPSAYRARFGASAEHQLDAAGD